MNSTKSLNLGGADNIRAPHQSTKLSRLPSFRLPAFDQPQAKQTNSCETCEKGKLETDNDLQQRTKVCRKCMSHYAVVDSRLNQAADAKAQSAKLAIFAGRLNLGK